MPGQTISFASATSTLDLDAMTAINGPFVDDVTGSKDQGYQGVAVFAESADASGSAVIQFALCYTDGAGAIGKVGAITATATVNTIRMDNAGTGGNYACTVVGPQGAHTVDLVGAMRKFAVSSTAEHDLHWRVGILSYTTIDDITLHLSPYRGI